MIREKPFKSCCFLVLISFLIICIHSGLYLSAQKGTKLDFTEMNKFKRAKRVFHSGQQLFLKKKFNKAEVKLKKAAEIFPQFSDAYFYLSQIYYADGKLKDAESFILKAEEHYKYMANLQNLTQQEYLNTLREQKHQLQEHLNDPMNKSLSSSGSTSSTSNPNRERDKIVKKIELIDQHLATPVVLPLDVKAPSSYRFIHGNIFLKTKRYKEAFEEYKVAISIDPKHRDSYNNLISLLLMFKQKEAALKYIKLAQENQVSLNKKLINAVKKHQ